MQANKSLLRRMCVVKTPLSSRLVQRTLMSASVVLRLEPTSNASIASNFTTTSTLTKSTIHKQWYHTTSVVALAERKRRRRRGGGDDNEDGGSSASYKDHSPVTDPTEFETAGKAILEKLHDSIKPMEKINDPFLVVRTEDCLIIQVEPALGKYEVEIDAEQQILILRSPISGAHTYFLSKKTQEWVDTIDFHNFEGIFVRDLIRHCKGVPKL